MKPVFQQIILEDGRAFRVLVEVDVVTLTALLRAVLHDDVTTLQRIVSVRGLPLGVGTHDDALQPRLTFQSVEHSPCLLADGLFALDALALHPLAILARVLALHDTGWVLTLAVADVLPHLGGRLSARFTRLLATDAVIVAVALAHLLDVSRLPFLDALDTFRALRQSELTGKSVERAVAHAAGFHQSAVLLFGKPLAEPRTLLIRQHPSLDALTASLAEFRCERSVNHLCGQHSRERVNLHLPCPLVVRTALSDSA